MSRKKKDAPAIDRNLLVPEVSETKLHPDLTVPQKKTFAPLNGEYHLIALDKDGNEKVGSDFSVPEKTFYHAFAKLIGTKFQIKKNLKK